MILTECVVNEFTTSDIYIVSEQSDIDIHIDRQQDMAIVDMGPLGVADYHSNARDKPYPDNSIQGQFHKVVLSQSTMSLRFGLETSDHTAPAKGINQRPLVFEYLKLTLPSSQTSESSCMAYLSGIQCSLRRLKRSRNEPFADFQQTKLYLCYSTSRKTTSKQYSGRNWYFSSRAAGQNVPGGSYVNVSNLSYQWSES